MSDITNMNGPGQVARHYEAIIRGLTNERDRLALREHMLTSTLANLLDAFGTPATRETEVELAMALSGYEAAGMKDEAHVLRTTIEAINAVLGSEVGE